jgi:hypothetical protein
VGDGLQGSSRAAAEHGRALATWLYLVRRKHPTTHAAQRAEHACHLYCAHIVCTDAVAALYFFTLGKHSIQYNTLPSSTCEPPLPTTTPHLNGHGVWYRAVATVVARLQQKQHPAFSSTSIPGRYHSTTTHLRSPTPTPYPLRTLPSSSHIHTSKVVTCGTMSLPL